MWKGGLLFLLFIAGITFIAHVSTSNTDVNNIDYDGRKLLDFIAFSSSSRKTFNKGDVSDRLCAADDSGDCHLSEYEQAVLRLSIVAFVMAPLAFLSFWIVCFGRTIFNCFGGWEKNPHSACFGISCCGRSCTRGNDADDFEGYSACGVYTTRFLLVLFTLCLIGVTVPGMMGNSHLSHGLKRPTSSFINFGIDLRQKLDHIVMNLTQLPYTKNINGSLTEVYQTFQEAMDKVHDADDKVSQVETYRFPIYIGILSLAPVVVLIGIAGGVFNCWQLTFCSAMILFLISTLMWSVFGLQYPMLIVLNDTCDEITLYNENVIAANITAHRNETFHPNRTSVIEVQVPLTSCTNSSFTKVERKVDDALNEAYSAACGSEGLQTPCLLSDNDYTRQAQKCDIILKNNIMQQPVCRLITDYKISGDLQKCRSAVAGVTNMSLLNFQPGSALCKEVTVNTCMEKQCQGPAAQIVDIIVEKLDVLSKYVYILRQEVVPLLGCYVFAPLVSALKEDVCHKLNPSFEWVEISMLAVGIILIPITILMILAAKRWRRDAMSPDTYRLMNHSYYNNDFGTTEKPKRTFIRTR
ncbi:hypothetical protein PROFUN_06925 [Planoprotostelium fungivorum]|uniref:Uncharacterized protein n=1 Tax=Planoprotostelium fungivorum TaxID=1890364 RepID=A0A2P6NMX8_9EUKA|nr:hypothetical protein PROFUN_06925 [Planoprotostelium fungivorum]